MNKKEATQRLVDGFSSVPQDWVQAVSDKNGDDFYGVMWGTMFIVNDAVDERRIRDLLTPVTDEDDEMYGTQKVSGTGIYAWDVGDKLVLGINGAGYDFYESHWIPLYETLEYNWHEKEKVSA